MMVDTNLPQPNDSFRWTQVRGQPALVCRALEPFAAHLITTRRWPLGQGADPHSGWEDVAAALDRPLVRVRQVHGAAVVVRRGGTPPTDHLVEADILVSDDPATAVSVQTADCVPILLVDPRRRAVAAVHAGWRGLAAAAPAAAVLAMQDQFGSRPSDLIAAAGPSIGPCCYEVGSDVYERFALASPVSVAFQNWFHPSAQATIRNRAMTKGGVSTPTPGKWYFDCWRATRDQLVSTGIPSPQIHVIDLCTASHPDAFCSYRRDGSGAGRMAAAIGPTRG
jgi:purine-nucleoside/S-methyl-5'-thioadenosine phosphorylase / adenosine deaminase